MPKRLYMLATMNTPEKKGSLIDANNKFAIEYLHLQYPWYTHQQIKDIITTAGPFYTNVDKQLRHKPVANATN